MKTRLERLHADPTYVKLKSTLHELELDEMVLKEKCDKLWNEYQTASSEFQILRNKQEEVAYRLNQLQGF
jgi:hypothetical protein